MHDDGPPLTPDDVEAAASVGRLPALARQLVFDGSWASLDVVLRYARESALPLGEVEDTVRALVAAADGLPEPRRTAAVDELRAAKHQAAITLLRRLDHEPLTTPERAAVGVAAGILADLGELERAARAFERAGDELRAADAYGALGDLDRMESCLRREEERRTRRQQVADALRRFELLVAAGERRAAIAAVASLPESDFDASSARAAARELERRLCQGRSVTLRFGPDDVVRFASVPATLGRDPSCEIPLRDPGVSRRHATLVEEGERLAVEDAGSRGGTLLAGARIGPRVALPAAGALTLGGHCVVAFREIGRALLELEGASGLDRALRAVVGANPLPLAAAFPGADGLRLRLDGRSCRLERASTLTVRMGGSLVGEGCDLAHGDVLEVDGDRGPFRIEVP